MAITGSSSMSYNAANRRIRTKIQQEYTDRKINALYVQSDMARLSFIDTTGNTWGTVPYTTDNGGDGYTNIFTVDGGGRYPVATRLAPRGTKWIISDNGTSLIYEGEAFLGQMYALIVLKPNTTNKSVNTIPITDNGSGYTTVPSVSISGDGADAEAVATINLATQEVSSVTVTVGGAGYSTASATIAGNATLGTPTLVADTVVQMAIFKNGVVMSDSIGNVIGDPATNFTTTESISHIGTIQKNDKFELKIQTDSTATLSYEFYNIVLSIRPIDIIG